MSDRLQIKAAGTSPSEAGHVEQVDASTASPHCSNELAADLARRSSQDCCYVHEVPASSASRYLDTNISGVSYLQQNLTIADLGMTARFVLCPSPALGDSLSKDQVLASLRCEDIFGDVYVIEQSSKEAWFNLVSEQLSFRLFYDPASDNMVLESLDKSSLRLSPILDDETTDESRKRLVKSRQKVEISPGPWRIFADDGLCGNGDEPLNFCDILLLRRRYCAQAAVSTQETGSKRKIELADAGRGKGQIDEDKSLVMISLTSRNGLGDGRLTITPDGNPMHNIVPGRTLTLRPCNTLANYHDSLALQNTCAGVNDSSENYSISNMRDISVTAAASIFYGRHSVHGLVAVKSLRQRAPEGGPEVQSFARMWEKEKRLLQSLDHVSSHQAHCQWRTFQTDLTAQPSIVKSFGADARFFSIFIEYLPHPDLAGMMSEPGYMFKGTTDDAIRVLGDMASALVYLATQKILHNDIKPANILYDGARGAVLIDFGLASSVEDKMCTGGTPWYVPPEFKRVAERGPKSDIFALGVTLLYLLKKTPLPDMLDSGWVIFKAKNHDAEGLRMERWLKEVFKMSLRLENNGIEVLVKQMVDDEPKSRISAQHLLESHKELLR
ncbi:hypothetical protein E4U42_007629 [Claviceps africana]|uniref:Protein kinase domain-containing protein n=1 Tax=Claviceps africana TaxID=83212 RepID=A0A8K0JGP1_9HYPO|nr:hypothetical protein E4U42_007629 [Claviceps africana]